LVSPEFSAVPNFGQPVIQTSEPCGKRSLIGGRFVPASIFAVIRALRHAAETRNDAAVENDAPSPSKAGRTILTAPNQVKIAPCLSIALIYQDLFYQTQAGCGAVAALQQPEAQSAKLHGRTAVGWTPKTRDHGMRIQYRRYAFGTC
jgi:hypothetical protein